MQLLPNCENFLFLCTVYMCGIKLVIRVMGHLSHNIKTFIHFYALKMGFILHAGLVTLLFHCV